MKYISSRDQFLQRRNEAFDMSGERGPMGNDINWGDSLVGRLVNSTLRVLNVQARRATIDNQIKELNRIMELFLKGEAYTINVKNYSNSKNYKSLWKGTLLAFFKKFINLVKFRIHPVTGKKIEDNEEWLEIVLEFSQKSNETYKTFDFSNVENQENQEEVEDSEKEANELATIIKEFNDVSEYVSETIDIDFEYVDEEEEKSTTPALNPGQKALDTVSTKVSKEEYNKIMAKNYELFIANFDHVIKIFELYSELKAIHNKSKNTNQSTEKNKGSEDDNINENVSGKVNVMDSIRKLHSVLSKVDVKRNKVDSLSIEYDKLITDDKFKSQIVQLYYNIINLNKNNVNEDLIIDLISKHNNELSTAIYDLYLSISEQSLSEIDKIKMGVSQQDKDNLKSELYLFKKSMEACLKVKIIKKDDIITEKHLKSFNLFINEELLELPPSKGSNLPTTTNKSNTLPSVNKKTFNSETFADEVEKIVESSYKIYMKYSKNAQNIHINVKDMEVKSEDILDKNVSGSNQGKRKIKVSVDYILEIARVFNKAYKKYMFDTIPGGRSEGKVTQRTFKNYEPLGGVNTSGGALSGWTGGPFRNKRIFNKWEDAVLSIISNKEYQVLFDKNTIYNVGGKDKLGLGTALVKFITDLLDGQKKLYLAGAQQELIYNLFDIKTDDTKIGNNNTKIASKIESMNLKWFVYKFNELNDDLINNIFHQTMIIDSLNENMLHYYFIPTEYKDESIVFIMNYHNKLDNLLTSKFLKEVTIENNFTNVINNTKNEIFYFKINENTFKDMFNTSGDGELQNIDLYRLSDDKKVNSKINWSGELHRLRKSDKRNELTEMSLEDIIKITDRNTIFVKNNKIN